VQKSWSLFLVVLLLSHVLSSQTSNTQAPAAPPEHQAEQPAPHPSADTSNFTSAKGFVLEEATPVKLRFNRTVSSADAHAGDTVDFEVLQDISVNGTPVISKGSFAFGTVTEAQPKRRMARGGKLEINIDYVKLVSSEKAALRAVVLSCCTIFPVHARQGHYPSEGNRVHCLCQRRYKARYCEVSARSRAATGPKRQQP
jgi:hypothetical protein